MSRTKGAKDKKPRKKSKLVGQLPKDGEGRLHFVRMDRYAHRNFGKLNPEERGKLIEWALENTPE